MAGLRHILAPDVAEPLDGRIKIFLGGSIEMGEAARWQDDLVRYLGARPYADRLDLYNPRRDDWDSSLSNAYECASFKEQVDWELEYQKQADILVYYFAADTVSPISLFELGLFYQKQPVIGVDPAYTRIGNLMVTADHFPLEPHVGWDAFVAALHKRISCTV